MTAKYACLQSSYWMSACFFYSFAQVFLIDKGLGVRDVGLILGASSLAAFLLQPCIAALIDKNARVNFKNSISAIIAIAILAGAGLFFANGTALVYILFITLMTLSLIAQPLINSIGFAYIDRGEKLNYAASRGIGSACYACIGWVFGKLANINVDYLLIGYIVLSALVIIINLLLAPKRSIEARQEAVGGNYALLRKHPHFFFMLLGMALIFLQHNLINAYLLSIVERVGGNEGSVGTAVFIAAILEVPIMLLYTRIQNRIRVDGLIKWAAVFFTIKSALLLLPFGLWGVYVSQSLQLAGYAIMIPATGYYVNAMVCESDKVKGQALLTTAIVIAGALGYLLGGVLIDSWGVFATVAAGTGVSLAGSFLLVVSSKRVSEVKE